MPKRYTSRSIYRNIFPDTGIAVSDSIEEGEVPPHSHQLRYVFPDFSVTSILEFIIQGANRFPPPWFHRTRHVYGIHFYSQYIWLIEMDIVRYIDMILVEHTGNIANHIPIQPHFRAIIDTIHL